MRRALVFALVFSLATAPACVKRTDGTADVMGSISRASRSTCAAVGPTAAIGGTVAALVSREASVSNDSPEAWITRGAALATALCAAVVAMFHAPKVETPPESPDASAAPAGASASD